MYNSSTVIRFLKPSICGLFTTRFTDGHFDNTVFLSLRIPKTFMDEKYKKVDICHNGFLLDLDNHKNKWSRHRSFLYGCDRSPVVHVLKLGIEILNLKQYD